MKYNRVGEAYNIMHAAGADGGLEHGNVGCNCVLGLYDVDFLHCNNVQLPSGCDLVYIHPIENGEIAGFYYFMVVEGTGRLMHCSKPPIGALSVWYRTQMYWSVCNDTDDSCVDNATRDEAKLAYENFLDDQHSWNKYGCSYEKHILDIIDRLADECCELVPQETESDIMQVNGPCWTEYDGHTYTCHTNQSYQNQSSIPSGIEAHLGPQVRKNGVSRDASLPSKTIGFLNHHSKEFIYIGPDRAPQNIESIDAYLKIADIIRDTGVPNYAQARIPLISGLNINEWERELRDYHDPLLLQYLKFGFPLSLVHSHELSNNTVSKA